MSREEYLDQLAYLLQDIPQEERDEAMEFYRDYFEEAGEGQEAYVISTLGSPEKVAAQIKSSLAGDDGHDGEYTETGYQDERFREDNKVPAAREEKGQKTAQGNGARQSFYEGGACQGDGPQNNRQGASPVRKRNNGLTIALIVVICIFASPLLLSLLGAAAGVILSVLAVILSVVAAAIASTLAALIGGVALFVAGIAAMWASPAVGCLMMGGAMIALAIGLLLAVATIWIAGKFVPWAVRGIINTCSKWIRRGGRRA